MFGRGRGGGQTHTAALRGNQHLAGEVFNSLWCHIRLISKTESHQQICNLEICRVCKKRSKQKKFRMDFSHFWGVQRQETYFEVQWTGIFNVHWMCLSGPSSYLQEQESACCSAPHNAHRARWYLWLLRHCMSFPISQSHLDVLSPVSWELKSTARQWDEIKWQELIKVKGLFVCFWYLVQTGTKRGRRLTQGPSKKGLTVCLKNKDEITCQVVLTRLVCFHR